ncbi:hypothetical protein Taro_021543, partial [Colocasia esculenta]|nr:hypothetical protein [Colocasia esculenta]
MPSKSLLRARAGLGGLAVVEVRCRTVVVAVCTLCVASSVSCERERLYRSVSRVAFLQVLGLFEFIACLTGLNSNPSKSSNLWVAARPSGSLAGVREVASFPAGFKCELQESVFAIVGCACYERGCWFARVAVEFVGGLRIRVGVSRRLREPTCGVAFNSAGLWSAEPVEVGIFARAKQILVCHVAPLVERCYTCLWLLSALCWLVVNSGELLPEFFSIGSGGSEVVCFASLTLRALPDGGLVGVVGVWLAVLLVEASVLHCGFPSCVRKRPIVCLLPLLSVGCSGWWCSAMAFGAVLCTVATFVAKVPFL